MTTSLPLRRKPRARKREEGDLVTAIRKAFASEWGAVVFRNNTGVLPDARGVPVKFGLCEGSSDLIGIVMCSVGPLGAPGVGRFFALEVKRKGERPSPAQERFLALVRSCGGFATWVDSVEGAIHAMRRARNEADCGADRVLSEAATSRREIP